MMTSWEAAPEKQMAAHLKEFLKELVPARKLNLSCSEEHLTRISRSITEWRTLAPFLGLTEAEEEEIEDSRGTAAQKIAMLRKWKGKLGSSATYKKLCKVFWELDRRDLVEVVCRLLRDDSSSESSSDEDAVKKASPRHQPALPPAIHHQSTSPLDCYASYLRDFYSSSPLCVTEKWPPTPGIQYISLAIIETEDITQAQADAFTKATLHGGIDQILKKKKAIKIEDVLKPREGQSSLRCVLVIGVAGIGKSTFVWELCRRWDEIEVMRGFSLVVLLQLREKRVQDAIANRSLADLFYYPDPQVQQGVVKEVIARNGAGVLLVFDGLDELPKSLCQNSLFSDIVQGKLLPKCTVLVTSRPSASAKLICTCNPRISRHIEVLGFTEPEIDQYTRSVLSSDRDLDAFLKYLDIAPSIRSIMYVPLNSAIVLHVYKHTSEEDRPIPTTMTQLYGELSRCLLKRYMLTEELVDESYSVPEDLKELPQQVYKQFCSLAELAFKGTMNEEVIFHRLPAGLVHMGFMSSTPELYIGRKESHNFLHLTVQEYLTAFHISQLPTEERGCLFKEHLSSSSLVLTVPRYAVTWRFLAGLTGFKDIGWGWVSPRAETSGSEEVLCGVQSGDGVGGCNGQSAVESSGSVEVLDSIDGQSDVECIDSEEVSGGVGSGDGVGGSGGWSDRVVELVKFHVQCLYEAQGKVVESVLDASSQAEYYGVELAPLDGFAVGYCVAHSKCVWDLHLSFSGPDVLKMLVCGLKSKQAVSGRIAKLDLSHGSLNVQGVKHMTEMPPVVLTGISDLNLSYCSLDGTALDLLADAIPLMRNLSSLNIGANNAREGETVKLLQALLQHRGVQCFNTVEVPMGGQEIELLSQLIAPSEPLKELVIDSDSMSTEMITTVMSTSSLSSLEIWYMSDFTSGMCSLLEVNCNLTSLKFGMCAFDITSLAHALHKNTTLKVLHIKAHENPPFTTQEVTALSEVLMDNHSLEEMKLRGLFGGAIGRDGVLTLVGTLQHNTTLKHLILPGEDRKYFSESELAAMDPRVPWL